MQKIEALAKPGKAFPTFLENFKLPVL